MYYPPGRQAGVLPTQEAITWYIPTQGGYNLVYTHPGSMVGIYTLGSMVRYIHPGYTSLVYTTLVCTTSVHRPLVRSP